MSICHYTRTWNTLNETISIWVETWWDLDCGGQEDAQIWPWTCGYCIDILIDPKVENLSSIHRWSRHDSPLRRWKLIIIKIVKERIRYTTAALHLSLIQIAARCGTGYDVCSINVGIYSKKRIRGNRNHDCHNNSRSNYNRPKPWNDQDSRSYCIVIDWSVV